MSDLSANNGSNKKKPRNNASKKAKRESLIKPLEDEAILSPDIEAGEMQTEDIADEMTSAASDADEEKIELLAFKLLNEEYVLDINRIKEIIRPVEITRVPRAPLYIKGIISLRGVIVPVYNLKNRLGLLETSEFSDDSQKRILIVNFDEEFIGIIVDAVTGVVKINEDIIEPTPQIIKGVDAEYLKGVARTNNRFLILLNLDRVLKKDN
ncbi:MAG: chemotaxis protein CheW [Nitrospirae bacterium]|nr:chemotaxis protein CheW [Nitrospirota bacterium]